jgi:hypothetical protein
MARADARTLLSLDRFARIMGAHPLHFNGVHHETLAPATTCGQPLMQHDWQVVDGVSRESIAVAIAEAETRITQWLGFKPLPVFERDERHNIVRPSTRDFSRVRMFTPNGLGVAVKLDYGHVVSGGIEGKTVIALSAVIAYSDEDADGYPETATITVPTTLTNPDEICIYFAGEGGDPSFEVRPITVTFASGFATITARREQFVIPSLTERLDSTRAIDGALDENFVSAVDVYRVFIDPSQQIQFLWENQWGSCGCGTEACPTCWLGAQFGCSVVRDYRLGLISGQPAMWNGVTGSYEYTSYAQARQPDRGRFWYRAGYRDQTRRRPSHEMDPRWERAIAVYAAAILERPFCGCRNIENISNYWRVDMSESSASASGGTSYRLTDRMLDNPLGTTRGAMHAWRMIRNEALGDSVGA